MTTLQVHSCLYFPELLSGDTSKEVMTWSTTQKGDYVYHEFGLQTPQQFLELNDRIEYGRGYHATALKDGVSVATCSSHLCRTSFASTGIPDQSRDMNFRVVSDTWPVMALSYDLKSVVKTAEPLVFIMGQPRDPLVQYQGPTSLADRSAFFQSQFQNIENAVRLILFYLYLRTIAVTVAHTQRHRSRSPSRTTRTPWRPPTPLTAN